MSIKPFGINTKLTHRIVIFVDSAAAAAAVREKEKEGNLIIMEQSVGGL